MWRTRRHEPTVDITLPEHPGKTFKVHRRSVFHKLGPVDVNNGENLESPAFQNFLQKEVRNEVGRRAARNAAARYPSAAPNKIPQAQYQEYNANNVPRNLERINASYVDMYTFTMQYYDNVWVPNKVRNSDDILAGDIIYTTNYWDEEGDQAWLGKAIVAIDKNGEKVANYFGKEYNVEYASLFRKLLDIDENYFNRAEQQLAELIDGDLNSATNAAHATIRKAAREAARRQEEAAAFEAFKAMPEAEQRALYERAVEEANQTFETRFGSLTNVMAWSDLMKLVQFCIPVAAKISVNHMIYTYMVIKFNEDDINYKNAKEYTVLHLSLIFPTDLVVSLIEGLLKKYADSVDIFAKNNDGKTPYELAIAVRGDERVKELARLFKGVEEDRRVESMDAVLHKNIQKTVRKYLGGARTRRRRQRRHRHRKQTRKY